MALDGAVKDYGSKKIGPITLRVESGEIVGFLGPNGSGKSTTIRMLLGLIRPSSGSVRLMQSDPIRQHEKALAEVGYSPELPNLQTFLSPRELLDLTGRLRGLSGRALESETPRLLADVGLAEYEGYKISKLSKGMVQRLSVAQAMVGSPKLLVLDEPTIGIDPAGVAHFRSLFRDFVQKGGTILLSSHILSEVEALCTGLAVIHSGSLVYRGELQKFVPTWVGARTISVELGGPADDALVRALSGVRGVTGVKASGEKLLIEVSKEADPRGEISKLIVGSGARLLSMGYSRDELQEAYVNSMRGTIE